MATACGNLVGLATDQICMHHVPQCIPFSVNFFAAFTPFLLKDKLTNNVLLCMVGEKSKLALYYTLLNNTHPTLLGLDRDDKAWASSNIFAICCDSPFCPQLMSWSAEVVDVDGCSSSSGTGRSGGTDS